MKLLIGTTNPGKVREFTQLLKDMPFELITPKDLGIEESPEETGKTLEENAILKAQFYLERANMPLLVDDTGFEIDALNGEPGIKVRRWPGHEATDQELVDYALEKLKGVPMELRGAMFRAVVGIATDAKNIQLFEGTMRGYIVEEPHYPIVPGYPFRSLFFAPALGMVLAQAEVEELNNLHRREAMEKARDFLLTIAKS